MMHYVGGNAVSVMLLVHLFVQLISQNQQEFIAMLNEGVQRGEAGQGDGGAMGQGGPMDQGGLGARTTIQVTTQEKEAIDRVRNDD